jgi:hypothetical protein
VSVPQVIPLQAVPDQTIQVYLAGQNCVLRVYQGRYGLFVDLYINSTIIRRGMEGLNLTKIVRDKYLGFIGDLFFYDTQGQSGSHYTGLGGRFVLEYDATL